MQTSGACGRIDLSDSLGLAGVFQRNEVLQASNEYRAEIQENLKTALRDEMKMRPNLIDATLQRTMTARDMCRAPSEFWEIFVLNRIRSEDCHLFLARHFSNGFRMPDGTDMRGLALSTRYSIRQFCSATRLCACQGTRLEVFPERVGSPCVLDPSTVTRTLVFKQNEHTTHDTRHTTHDTHDTHTHPVQVLDSDPALLSARRLQLSLCFEGKTAHLVGVQESRCRKTSVRTFRGCTILASAETPLGQCGCELWVFSNVATIKDLCLLFADPRRLMVTLPLHGSTSLATVLHAPDRHHGEDVIYV